MNMTDGMMKKTENAQNMEEAENNLKDAQKGMEYTESKLSDDDLDKAAGGQAVHVGPKNREIY